MDSERNEADAMKTYAKVITELAQRKLDDLRGGGQGRVGSAAELVAFIYSVKERDVEFDVNEEYKKLVDSR